MQVQAIPALPNGNQSVAQAFQPVPKLWRAVPALPVEFTLIVQPKTQNPIQMILGTTKAP